MWRAPGLQRTQGKPPCISDHRAGRSLPGDQKLCIAGSRVPAHEEIAQLPAGRQQPPDTFAAGASSRQIVSVVELDCGIDRYVEETPKHQECIFRSSLRKRCPADEAGLSKQSLWLDRRSKEL